MKIKTVEKNPLFIGFKVRTKKGDGIIVRDGGPGGNMSVLMSKNAEKSYANQLVEVRMGQFVLTEPDELRDLCDDLLGEGPDLVKIPPATVEQIVEKTRENLGINNDAVSTSTKAPEKKSKAEVKTEMKKEKGS